MFKTIDSSNPILKKALSEMRWTEKRVYELVSFEGYSLKEVSKYLVMTEDDVTNAFEEALFIVFTKFNTSFFRLNRENRSMKEQINDQKREIKDLEHLIRLLKAEIRIAKKAESDVNNYSKCTPISELELSARPYNCLHRAGYRYVEEVIALTPEEVDEIDDLGVKSFNELKQQLIAFGYKEIAPGKSFLNY